MSNMSVDGVGYHMVRTQDRIKVQNVNTPSGPNLLVQPCTKSSTSVLLSRVN
jgi:hypothetical protein